LLKESESKPIREIKESKLEQLIKKPLLKLNQKQKNVKKEEAILSS